MQIVCFFLGYFQQILQGFRGMKPLWGCSKVKLNIKGKKLNIYALIVIKKTEGACHHGLLTAKIIDHSTASSAYHPHVRGTF